MFKTAEIHFLTNGVSCCNEAEHLTFDYVSAGQYHIIKQSAVSARSQLSILAKSYLFLFVNLLVCDHMVTIMRNEVVLFCELVHFKIVFFLWCINVKMQ